jgi:hypothetical protein
MDAKHLATIRRRLNSNYPGFQFEIKDDKSIDGYKITAKGKGKSKDLLLPGNTPMRQFWESIQKLMKSM